MANAFENHVENLRKESRTLLARLARNSQIIDDEIEKIQSRSSSAVSQSNNRNDKVNKDFSTQTFCLPSNTKAQGDMTVGGRILITSKRPTESLPLRKPVKGCYCNNERKKIQFRSPMTIYKPCWPCDHCKSHFDIRNPSPDTENNILSPALSCDTLRRVQKINYTPTSQFLRRVQKKISQNYDTCVDYSDSNLPNSRPTRRVSYVDVEPNQTRKTSSQNIISTLNTDTITLDNHQLNCQDTEKITEIHEPTIIKKRHEPLEVQTIFQSKAIPSRKSSKVESTTKKTINSTKKTQNVSSSEEIILRSKSKKKKGSRILSQKTCSKDCCSINQRTRSSKQRESRGQSKCADCCHCQSRVCPSTVTPANNSLDNDVLELRKFREKNYYDTHGSSHTLSSTGSGSLEQYVLNDRLFPERAGKVHRDNLVVTLPSCATKQFKRVHYFPRYIVKQEKTAEPVCACSKKRKYQTCPLTGHAIDVGILKVPRPVNSLALAFQKGVA